MNTSRLKYAMISLLLMLTSMTAIACTGTKIQAQDGSVLFGRTFEFGADTHSNIILIPRNFLLTANAGSLSKNLSWKTKYAVLGMNAESLPVIVEGVNEKGLRVGDFYFPGFAGYQKLNEEEAGNALSSYDLGTWILTSFATIDEVKNALPAMNVSDAQFKPWGFTLPLHYIVSEPNGKSLIIEYLDGKLNLYDDNMGVLTNSPDFKWQQLNLNNYVNLSASEALESPIPQLKLKEFGLGSGMLGLPGDSTPPSRFVRMVFYTATMLPIADAEQAVNKLFHLLNNFDIPMGSSIEKRGDTAFYDHSQWMTATDLKKQILYFKTYDNQNIKKVDMSQFDLNANAVQVIDLSGSTHFEDVSKTSKPFVSSQH